MFSKRLPVKKKFFEQLQMAFGQIIQGYVHPWDIIWHRSRLTAVVCQACGIKMSCYTFMWVAGGKRLTSVLVAKEIQQIFVCTVDMCHMLTYVVWWFLFILLSTLMEQWKAVVSLQWPLSTLVSPRKQHHISLEVRYLSYTCQTLVQFYSYSCRDMGSKA